MTKRNQFGMSKDDGGTHQLIAAAYMMQGLITCMEPEEAAKITALKNKIMDACKDANLGEMTIGAVYIAIGELARAE